MVEDCLCTSSVSLRLLPRCCHVSSYEVAVDLDDHMAFLLSLPHRGKKFMLKFIIVFALIRL